MELKDAKGCLALFGDKVKMSYICIETASNGMGAREEKRTIVGIICPVDGVVCPRLEDSFVETFQGEKIYFSDIPYKDEIKVSILGEYIGEIDTNGRKICTNDKVKVVYSNSLGTIEVEYEAEGIVRKSDDSDYYVEVKNAGDLTFGKEIEELDAQVTVIGEETDMKPYQYYNGSPMPVINDGRRNVQSYEISDWIDKLKEEIEEVEKAGNQRNRAEELTDVITVCTSWLNAMGYTSEKRQDLQRKVNRKNDNRGYFNELEELNRCPFCGGEVLLRDDTQKMSIIHKNQNDGCIDLLEYAYTSDNKKRVKEELIKRWNRRGQ